MQWPFYSTKQINNFLPFANEVAGRGKGPHVTITHDALTLIVQDPHRPNPPPPDIN